MAILNAMLSGYENFYNIYEIRRIYGAYLTCAYGSERPFSVDRRRLDTENENDGGNEDDNSINS